MIGASGHYRTAKTFPMSLPVDKARAEAFACQGPIWAPRSRGVGSPECDGAVADVLDNRTALGIADAYCDIRRLGIGQVGLRAVQFAGRPRDFMSFFRLRTWKAPPANVTC